MITPTSTPEAIDKSAADAERLRKAYATEADVSAPEHQALSQASPKPARP